MFVTVLTLHILVAVILVFIILLQSGRGAELGAAFGGMGQATYGRGKSTFISKFTTSMAVVFMITSLTLAFMTTERPRSSIIKEEPAAAAQAESGEEAPAQNGEENQLQTAGEQAAPAAEAQAEAAGEPRQPMIEQNPLEQTEAPPR